MLHSIARRIASQPLLYELIQFLAGQPITIRHLRRAIDDPEGALDVGSAGGGATRRLLRDPVSVDVDFVSIAALKRRNPEARAVVGSAAALPFRARSFRSTVCSAVAHHLDDPTFVAALAEIARVTSGKLVFVDGLRNDRRLISRLMWRYDRGRNPRTREELLTEIRRSFEVERIDEYQHGHQVMLCVARPKSDAGL